MHCVRRRPGAEAIVCALTTPNDARGPVGGGVSRNLLQNGRATDVEWIDSRGDRHIEPADRIVVAYGAMETPRLLLLSGLTNEQIGRKVMFHMQTFVFGVMPFRVHGHLDRPVTHVHDVHIIVDKDARAAAVDAGLPWIKGGLVEHCSPSHLISEAKQYPWGPQHKIMMPGSPMRDRLLGFCMQGDDLPQLTNRVDLDPAVTDIWGLPVARTTYQAAYPRAGRVPSSWSQTSADHEGSRR